MWQKSVKPQPTEARGPAPHILSSLMGDEWAKGLLGFLPISWLPSQLREPASDIPLRVGAVARGGGASHSPLQGRAIACILGQAFLSLDFRILVCRTEGFEPSQDGSKCILRNADRCYLRPLCLICKTEITTAIQRPQKTKEGLFDKSLGRAALNRVVASGSQSLQILLWPHDQDAPHPEPPPWKLLKSKISGSLKHLSSITG